MDAEPGVVRQEYSGMAVSRGVYLENIVYIKKAMEEGGIVRGSSISDGQQMWVVENELGSGSEGVVMEVSREGGNERGALKLVKEGSVRAVDKKDGGGIDYEHKILKRLSLVQKKWGIHRFPEVLSDVQRMSVKVENERGFLLYGVVELVRGLCWGDCMSKSVDEQLEIARQVVESIEMATEAGVVITDRKYGTDVRWDGKDVCVLDWGVARQGEKPNNQSQIRGVLEKLWEGLVYDVSHSVSLVPFSEQLELFKSVFELYPKELKELLNLFVEMWGSQDYDYSKLDLQQIKETLCLSRDRWLQASGFKDVEGQNEEWLKRREEARRGLINKLDAGREAQRQLLEKKSQEAKLQMWSEAGDSDQEKWEDLAGKLAEAVSLIGRSFLSEVNQKNYSNAVANIDREYEQNGYPALGFLGWRARRLYAFKERFMTAGLYKDSSLRVNREDLWFYDKLFGLGTGAVGVEDVKKLRDLRRDLSNKNWKLANDPVFMELDLWDLVEGAERIGEDMRRNLMAKIETDSELKGWWMRMGLVQK